MVCNGKSHWNGWQLGPTRATNILGNPRLVKFHGHLRGDRPPPSEDDEARQVRFRCAWTFVSKIYVQNCAKMGVGGDINEKIRWKWRLSGLRWHGKKSGESRKKIRVIRVKRTKVFPRSLSQVCFFEEALINPTTWVCTSPLGTVRGVLVMRLSKFSASSGQWAFGGFLEEG